MPKRDDIARAVPFRAPASDLVESVVQWLFCRRHRELPIYPNGTGLLGLLRERVGQHGLRRRRDDVVFVFADGCSEHSEFNPQAKFLAILRNPVEQLPSFHNILLTQGNEDVIDFEQAWNLRTERRANRHIPSKCSDYRFLDYGRTACYGTQVQRVFDLAGQDRVKVLLYENYVSDTKSCYKEVLEFLGLEDDGRDDFPVVNPSRATQSRLLTHLTHKPSEFRQKWGSRSAML